MGLFKFLLYAVGAFKKPDPKKHTPQNYYSKSYKITAQSEADVKSQIQNLPSAKVKWVIDGDTVIAVKSRKEVVIRLDSIDCPENGQHWGDIAKYGLMKIVNKQNIKLEEHGMDCHGRILATIYIWHEKKNEWSNVNERMVTLGHGWVMRRYYDHLPKDRQNKLDRLERWAKSKKLGLWKTPNPTPPWVWRNEDKYAPF